jgi:hypothetical protein
MPGFSLATRRDANEPLVPVILNAFLVVRGSDGCVNRKGEWMTTRLRDLSGSSIFHVYRFSRTCRQNSEQSQHGSPDHLRPLHVIGEAMLTIIALQEYFPVTQPGRAVGVVHGQREGAADPARGQARRRWPRVSMNSAGDPSVLSDGVALARRRH